jgi:Integrase core domain
VRRVSVGKACYRSITVAGALTGVCRHQRTKPYTPKHNGKVERYHRILAEELLYARTWTSKTQRTNVWSIHYHYHRPHHRRRPKPPATRLLGRVPNVITSNT